MTILDSITNRYYDICSADYESDATDEMESDGDEGLDAVSSSMNPSLTVPPELFTPDLFTGLGDKITGYNIFLRVEVTWLSFLLFLNKMGHPLFCVCCGYSGRITHQLIFIPSSHFLFFLPVQENQGQEPHHVGKRRSLPGSEVVAQAEEEREGGMEEQGEGGSK